MKQTTVAKDGISNNPDNDDDDNMVFIFSGVGTTPIFRPLALLHT
jgi:hypothetical protein